MKSVFTADDDWGVLGRENTDPTYHILDLNLYSDKLILMTFAPDVFVKQWLKTWLFTQYWNNVRSKPIN